MSTGRSWLMYVLVALAAGSAFILGSGRSWADDDDAVQTEDAVKQDDASGSEQPTGMDPMQQGVGEPSTSDTEDK